MSTQRSITFTTDAIMIHKRRLYLYLAKITTPILAPHPSPPVYLHSCHHLWKVCPRFLYITYTILFIYITDSTFINVIYTSNLFFKVFTITDFKPIDISSNYCIRFTFTIRQRSCSRDLYLEEIGVREPILLQK